MAVNHIMLEPTEILEVIWSSSPSSQVRTLMPTRVKSDLAKVIQKQ